MTLADVEVLTDRAHKAAPPVIPQGADPAPVTRGQILRLQSSMAPIAEAMPEPEHRFTPGLYIRTFRMPAGALVVGKTHLHAHPLFIQSGHALIVSEFGRQEVLAGDFSISKPGAKRIVYAFEPTVFTTVHANPDDSEDIEVIEPRHIKPESPEEIEAAVRGLLR